MAEPNLNVEFSAVTDEKGKFRRLAKLLGLADGDHARGKCEHLWLACTRRGETDLPQWLVEEILGERGPAALVDAELARWTSGRGDSKTRRMRISGARKHCTWLTSKTEQSSNAGKSNARTANRVRGKFAAKPTIETHPSDSDSDSDPIPEDQSSPSAHAISPSPVPAAPAPSVPVVSPPAPAREDIARTHAAPYDHTDDRSRGRLAEATYQRVSDARVALAAELRLPAQLPFPPVTPSSRARAFCELLDRVREEGAGAPIVCDRVVATLIAQARQKRSIEWLSLKSFSTGAWTHARDGIHDEPARVGRYGKPEAPSMPQPAKFAPIEPLADPVTDAGEFVSLLATLNGEARAPPASSSPTPDQQPQSRPKAAT